jgi:DNA-binding MarR family transcriptional regulator
MNGLSLFLLGRRLMKLGEEAIPSSGFRELPTSVRSVLVDAFSYPDSSISEIASRTGFPQSHVSMSVARLRELGALSTRADPSDRRRTLVRATSGALERGAERGSDPVDATLRAAMVTETTEKDLAQALTALDVLATALMPRLPFVDGPRSAEMPAKRGRGPRPGGQSQSPHKGGSAS